MATRRFLALIIGAPGSGKGTVADRIVKNFQVKHFAAGDLLRSQVQNQTDLGREIGEKLKTGELLPCALINKVMLTELKFINDACLLDGYPRTVTQAKALDEHTKISTVIFLNIPFPIIVDRLKSRWTHVPSGRVYNTEFNPPKKMGFDDITGEPLIQREDDKPETVKRRLDVFKNQTSPLLDFYRSRGLLTEFAGKTTNEIWPHVLTHLKEVIPKGMHLNSNTHTKSKK